MFIANVNQYRNYKLSIIHRWTGCENPEKVGTSSIQLLPLCFRKYCTKGDRNVAKDRIPGNLSSRNGYTNNTLTMTVSITMLLCRGKGREALPLAKEIQALITAKRLKINLCRLSSLICYSFQSCQLWNHVYTDNKLDLESCIYTFVNMHACFFVWNKKIEAISLRVRVEHAKGEGEKLGLC